MNCFRHNRNRIKSVGFNMDLQSWREQTGRDLKLNLQSL